MILKGFDNFVGIPVDILGALTSLRLLGTKWPVEMCCLMSHRPFCGYSIYGISDHKVKASVHSAVAVE